MCIDCHFAISASRASADTRPAALVEDWSNINAQVQNLQEYAKARLSSSNDCAWLYEFLSSDAISAGKVDSLYHVRVYYKELRDTSIAFTKDFEPGEFLSLERCLTSTHVRAVLLCHRDSS